jgi:hypothetical protein
MKRSSIVVLSIILSVLAVPASAQKKSELCVAQQAAKKKTLKSPTQKELNKKGIAACPDTGCGSVDKLLNHQKNTTEGDPDSFRDMTFAEVDAIPICVAGYKGIGDGRKPLRDAGEGTMVRVVAWALDSRPQKSDHGESCNCGLTGIGDPENTDVHIVLVDDEILKIKKKATKAKPATATKKAVPARSAIYNTLKARESESLTAEYAPRVRVSRTEEFDGAKLKKMIDPTHGGRLQVRVTGLLMYDSEHAYQNPLVRKSNWEIHPVFRLEFCPQGKVCAEGDWIDINK